MIQKYPPKWAYKALYNLASQYKHNLSYKY